MKKLAIILCLAVAMASCTSKGCRIRGTVENLAPDMVVYVTNMWDPRQIIDSTTVVNNSFRFKKIKHAPTFAHLVTKSGRPLTHLFIEEGDVVISGDANESKVEAHGTPANDGLMKVLALTNQIRTEYNEAAKSGDEAKANDAYDRYILAHKECFETNTTNPLGLFMFQQLGYFESAASLLAMYDKLSEEVKAMPLAQTLKGKAERKFRTEPQAEGSDYVPHYINIEQPNLEGQIVSLKSVVENKKNRYVLLDFWASWCGPCMHEMPYLREAYKKYHKKGFEIYGVSFDKSQASWSNAIKDLKMKWVNVSLLTGFENSAAEEYAVSSIPTNFLIDCSNGVIIAKNLRGTDVEKKLAELLK